MRLKKILFVAVTICLNSMITHAQLITLGEVQKMAETNYPAIARYDIIEKTKEFSISNANKAYLPQGTLSTLASWQSDVTQIEMDTPEGMPPLEIPVPDQDQYRVVAELNQLIWDGGNISAQKKNLNANAELETRQLDTEVYALRERVNHLYFGILLIKGNLQQHDILEKELQRNHDNVQTYVSNGMANEVDLSTVKVEQLKAKQQRIQLESTLEAYIRMISVVAGQTLHKDMVFVKPNPETDMISPIINRPELKMFTAQEEAIESQKSLLKAKNMPKLSAFAQGGYGKPGLNMFDTEFSPYFSGGVRLSWNFGNLYTLNDEKKKIDLQKQVVNIQRETFLYNLYIQIPQQLTEIEKYKKTMQDDDEIIRHHTLIREAAEVRVENGTMTVSDLMKEINSEEAAKQAKTLHEIQYLMSIYSLKHTTNQ
ncbi:MULTISPECIES: TolC family protein [unclassified Proteiniphilum]|jgi:outer membrane protein TolC|uniref:TolC family protein n=1 Tax=unclassified Proteiniphilum TaxID=2622718 RepID=UPI000E837843|nr:MULTISPECIES: TolC family protein [unclassified Proteiniphilum]HBG58493.1 transporter [Porphyromonadaceae bacterium]